MNFKDELLKYKSKDNEVLIEEILEFIKASNVQTINQLKEAQDALFTLNKKVLNDKQRIQYCYEFIKNAYYDYDGLSIDEIRVLKKLKDSIVSSISDEEKIINLIKINIITNREIKFYKEAYEGIIKGLF